MLRRIIEQVTHHKSGVVSIEAVDIGKEFSNGKVEIYLGNDNYDEGAGTIELTRDELIKLRDALTELIDSQIPKE